MNVGRPMGSRGGWPGREPILLWLRGGAYRSYADYDLEVVGLLPPRDAERGQ